MNKHLLGLVALLTALGLGIFLFKVYYLNFPLTPDTSSIAWQVEVKIVFDAGEDPVKVELHVPGSRSSLPILNENFISHGFGLTTTRIESNRVAIWSKRRPGGRQTLYYRALVELGPSVAGLSTRPPGVTPPELGGADTIAALAILEEARQMSADVDTLVAQLVERLRRSTRADQYVWLLRGGRAERDHLERVVEILALAEIPARTVHGIPLDLNRGPVGLEHWLEVWDRGSWRTYHGETGAPADMSAYLVFWRGDNRLAKVTGGTNLRVQIIKEPLALKGLEAAASRERMLSPELWAFSPQSLPLATQNVYRILLLVPVGVFVLVLMRNVVGVRTFGTFMPVLIALAFRETHLVAGIILVTVLVALGLVIRFYLERLKLLLVPRLAAVLIIVILLMLSVSIICNHLGIESGLSVALFPMVIITMIIERMSIVWEERGPREAIEEGVGSLACASLAYILMSWNALEHLVVTFPELLLVLLAATILLGRYSGYRLLELRRFRALVTEPA